MACRIVVVTETGRIVTLTLDVGEPIIDLAWTTSDSLVWPVLVPVTPPDTGIPTTPVEPWTPMDGGAASAEGVGGVGGGGGSAAQLGTSSGGAAGAGGLDGHEGGDGGVLRGGGAGLGSPRGDEVGTAVDGCRGGVEGVGESVDEELLAPLSLESESGAVDDELGHWTPLSDSTEGSGDEDHAGGDEGSGEGVGEGPRERSRSRDRSAVG
jgi:hypothetical protein